MDKIGDNCENGKSRASKGAPSDMDFKKYKALQLEERVALIQELIPLGLMAVAQELNDEVEQLISKGPDEMARRYGYSRNGKARRTIASGRCPKSERRWRDFFRAISSFMDILT